jgi:hypothetical protein
MRGIKTINSPVLSGYQIFHNFIRPHEALRGKTPGKLAVSRSTERINGKL